MSTDTPNEVSQLVATLQEIEQALTKANGTDLVSDQTKEALRTGILNLRKLETADTALFKCVNKRFITRQEGKQLVGDFNTWSSDIFQAGPLIKMTPLYLEASDVGRLVDRALGQTTDRTDDPEGYIELLFGKKDNHLTILFAAVDKDGNRLLGDPKSDEAAQDLLDYAGPCPLPPCPEDL
jgi:hypothetical protein